MLKIKRVTLENFCNIPSVDFEFTDGLTVVTGPNGSGKTSFLNAIYSVFTGAFDRGPGDAAGCIRQNQDGKTYTEVLGSVLDRPFRIRRDIRFQSDGKTAAIGHGLWLDGNRKKESESKNEIAAWIESTTGLTREMMQEYLFIGQYDFVDYFSRRGSERWKKFSALCGTKSYEKRFEDYSKLLGVDRAGYDKATVSVAFLQEAIREAEDDLVRIRSEWERARAENGGNRSLERLTAEQEAARTKLQRIERLQATLEHLDREKGTVQTALARCNESYEECRRKIEEADFSMRRLAGEIGKVRFDLEQLLSGTTFERERTRLDEIVKSNARRELLEKEIRAAQARYDAIGEPAAPDEEKNLKLRGDFDNVLRRIGNIEADLRTTRSLIDLLNELGRSGETTENCQCPLCGAESMHWKRDLNNLEQTRDRLRKEREACERERADLEIRLAGWEKAKKQAESMLAERRGIAEQLERFRVELESCPAPDPQAATKRERLNDMMRFIRETSLQLEHDEKTVASTNELKDKYLGERDRLQSDREKIETEMNRVLEESHGLTFGDLEPTREEIRERDRQIESIRTQERRIAELEGQRAESERQRDRLQKQYDEQCRKRADFGNANVWFDKCDRALRWLHKDGLPRLIHASVLNDLVQVVNYELRQYDEPFRVTVNEDLTFRVHFPDGTKDSSSNISGGQRYLLVLSFLMAMNRTFARNLGIMFLDEPTAFLDTENVSFLIRILEQLKRVLRTRHQQLVVVTHVEELAQVADTVYSLARPFRPDTGPDPSPRSERLPLAT